MTNNNVELTPEVKQLAEDIFRIVREAKIGTYKSMEALGYACQATVGMNVPREKQEEYIDYSINLAKEVFSTMDKFHEERPSMPIAIHLLTMGHIYQMLAYGLRRMEEEEEYDQKPGAGESGPAESTGK